MTPEILQAAAVAAVERVDVVASGARHATNARSCNRIVDRRAIDVDGAMLATAPMGTGALEPPFEPCGSGG